MNELFPVFIKTDKIKVLIIGGGEVAAEKLHFLLKSSPHANIHLVAVTIREDILELAKEYPNITLEQRFFKSSDVDQKQLVIIAANNKGLNERVKRLAQQHAFLLNAADQPEYCDFYLGGIVTKGDLKLAISTNGKAPVLAKRLRQFFEQELPDSTIELTKNLGKLRQQLKGSFSEKLQLLNQLTKNMIQE